MVLEGDGKGEQESKAGDLYGREEVIVRAADGTPRMRRWTDLHIAVPVSTPKKPDQGSKRSR